MAGRYYPGVDSERVNRKAKSLRALIANGQEKEGTPKAGDDQATVQLIANFLRQIAGTDWSKKDLAGLADAVETGERKVIFDPNY